MKNTIKSIVTKIKNKKEHNSKNKEVDASKVDKETKPMRTRKKLQ